MKKRVQKLYEALTTGQMICYRLAAEPEVRHYGFVVGVEASFALIHYCNLNIVCLDGYSTVPLTEMRKVQMVDEEAFLSRALQVKGMQPLPQPDILLLDFPGMLSSANAHFPLITVHIDHQEPDTCYVGRVETMTSKTLTLRQINIHAQWSRSRSFKFKDITRVEFGGGYEQALWMVAEQDRRRATPQG
jgi:hypothetical protein